jgi:hypothetical protein
MTNTTRPEAVAEGTLPAGVAKAINWLMGYDTDEFGVYFTEPLDALRYWWREPFARMAGLTYPVTPTPEPPTEKEASCTQSSSAHLDTSAGCSPASLPLSSGNASPSPTEKETSCVSQSPSSSSSSSSESEPTVSGAGGSRSVSEALGLLREAAGYAVSFGQGRWTDGEVFSLIATLTESERKREEAEADLDWVTDELVKRSTLKKYPRATGPARLLFREEWLKRAREVRER